MKYEILDPVLKRVVKKCRKLFMHTADNMGDKAFAGEVGGDRLPVPLMKIYFISS